jgi:hypothetical protein
LGSSFRWWQALLEGEDLLEMSKIEAVRPMEELDEEEQMKLQELCWNEERKRQGLPTSDDMASYTKSCNLLIFIKNFIFFTENAQDT